MADRIFAGALLLVIVGYAFIAFTIIQAPFQYDPLGPETWPQILGVLAGLCCLFILARPDVNRFPATLRTVWRLAAVIVLLSAYAWAFERLGFILATTAFCTLFAAFLGARWPFAAAFGTVTGVVGYFLCTRLLELNLPEGMLPV
ncbi:MAG: tripartite tricarboxylate transporter TctB family protein [Pseudomonadota bacterium]